MSSRREGAAFSCLHMDVLHKLLDMAFLRMSTVVAGYMDRHNHPGIVVGKLVLYIWCPRPYHEDALCLPRELDDFPKTLGWQHFSRTRDTDPLHGLVDDCINILRRFLPDTFDLHELDNTEGTTLTSALADGVRPVHRAARRVSSSNVGHLRRSTPTRGPWLHAPSRTLGALRRSSPTRAPTLRRARPHANSRISTFRRICSSENKTPRVLPKIGARRHPRIEHIIFFTKFL